MPLLVSKTAFKQNLRWSLQRYRLWWLLLLVTAAFDCMTTLYFVSLYGLAAEANPTVRWLVGMFGLLAGLLISKVLQVLAVAGFVGLNRRIGNLMLMVVVLLNCLAVLINTAR